MTGQPGAGAASWPACCCVVIAATPSIGVKLDTARQLNQATSLVAWMIVVLIIGILVDIVFGRADTAIRRRWGVLDNGA